MVTLLGESQADHQEAGQNQTKKRQLLQYQGIAGVFSLYKVRDLRHEMVTKKTYFRDQFVTCPTFRILGHGMSEIVGLLS